MSTSLKEPGCLWQPRAVLGRKGCLEGGRGRRDGSRVWTLGVSAAEMDGQAVREGGYVHSITVMKS